MIMARIGSVLTQVTPRIFYLDARMANEFGVSGVYLIVGDGITLIETGTTLTAPDILKAVTDMGYRETDIRRAVVTHIHLDHSGGTGWLARRLPDLTVYVHDRGAKHLENPTALINSAKMVYGDLDTITALHGDILPVPGRQIIPVKHCALEIDHTLTLELFDAPGHATHHLGIFEAGSGCLFSGEALGHHYPETGSIHPAVAPPGFNLEDSMATIDFMEGLKPKIICFSQFGQHNDPVMVAKEAKRQLRWYHDLLLEQFRRGRDIQGAISFLKKRQPAHEDPFSEAMLVSIATGYHIYFTKAGVL
jgi:glyoxylase-like metal-dependent hydrolase (beta-lactamase superfamily II)